ncbi:MAG: hypothetical protein QXH67_00570, partial [Candidatus Bathyarchaeia archaeon]
MFMGFRVGFRDLLPGFLAFLGYYDLVSGLTIPLRFTVDRVTHTYLVQLPLFWWLELDFAAYITALIILISLEDDLRLRKLHLIPAILSASILLAARLLDQATPAYLILGSASL